MSRKTVSLIIIILLVLHAASLSAASAPKKGITVLFSPRDECGKIILDKINGAESSIELAMYHITSRVLSGALASAAKRGVKVRVFLDGENAAEHYSKATFLKKSGVPLKLEQGEGLMHNKFCIIDDSLLITGSYNWTTSADLRNDENVTLIDSEETVKAYKEQFEKYWRGDYTDKAYYIDKNALKKIKAE